MARSSAVVAFVAGLAMAAAGCGKTEADKAREAIRESHADAQRSIDRIAQAERRDAKQARDRVIWARARLRIARYCVTVTGGETPSSAATLYELGSIDTLIRLYREDPRARTGHGTETRRQALVDQASALDYGCDRDGARRLDRVLREG